MIKIAVIGFGVIGSGVAEVIDLNRTLIAKEIGEDMEVKYILDLRDFSGHPMAEKFVKDFSVIENDPEISVVAEMIGGRTFAFDYAIRAMKAGKSVVTSNKEVVAYRGKELLQTAKENGVSYLFEASVGGGIPIIRPMRLSLAGNDIVAIDGILNGTTNYILTQMETENKTMEDALKEAQAKGYAEANPTADIEGHDTCRKICILAAMASGKLVCPDGVSTKGITALTLRDIADARALGCAVKLLGRAQKNADGKLSLSVAPCMVPMSNPIAGVSDVFNGIMVTGNATGELMFYGKGAGKLPTAGAVLSDIIEAVKAMKQGSPVTLTWEEAASDDLCAADEVACVYYLRVKSGENMPAWQKVTDTDGECSYVTEKITKAALEQILEGKEAVSLIELF